MNNELWKKTILPIGSTFEQVISNLDQVAKKIVLIVGLDGKFLGIISDGDIRRGLLKGARLSDPINEIIQRNPFVAPSGMSRDSVARLMIVNKVQQIPILDIENNLVGLYLWDEVMEISTRNGLMVVMAGGRGLRLMPHTSHCPKPMVEIAGKPMLEHILLRAKSQGFNQFIFSINYLGHIIENYFKNGDSYGVEIKYIKEEIPLGTAGSLATLVDELESNFIVTNGDVIADIQYGELLDFHERHISTATMAVKQHEWQNPFGVVRTDGVEIIGFEEKPVYRTHINAGIYALSYDALRLLNQGEYCDMPTLFERLKNSGHHTIAYPMHEPWLDVGRPEDLIEANLGARP